MPQLTTIAWVELRFQPLTSKRHSGMCMYGILYAHLLPIVADYEVCVMQICQVQILLYKHGHVLNTPTALHYQPLLGAHPII